ncbi:hypothetical protein lacNasYZ03_11420 [Lactobacillus nasalidis]|uniref:Uncharacterized protein n=1 Tax=Lactobacillus nasalidis TaxID=2797258 RepID=A0ABQ3W7X3_9LACO|nr:hypothetical protein [Lactobacillus nasalidis]GHV97866.1 hypothetical protein lacNasYZ01_10480 [Lactobacillus nasalidis]GHW00096.1 hypothetical protein lacNasYZ02_15250 [Lactobacillus nasalidis]GHW01455.1 hypothetical protein lacNasYZ03_11420 [Lactobacillus nasalidis]
MKEPKEQKDEKKYSLELNAEDFADVFAGIWIDYMARVVNDMDNKRLLLKALKLLVIYLLESGKATGKDFGKIGVEMINLANDPREIRKASDRYQALVADFEALAKQHED